MWQLIALVGAALVLWRLRVISEPPTPDNDKVENAFDTVADRVADGLNTDNGNGLATQTGAAAGQVLGQLWGTGSNTGLAALGPGAVDIFAGSKNNIVAKVVASAALTILPSAILGYALMHGGLSAIGASFSLFAPYIIVAIWAIAVIIVVGDGIAQLSQVSNRKNARDAWDKQWLAVFNATRDNLHAAFPDYSGQAISRPATHFADGFMEQLNRLNFLNALKEPLAAQEAANVWTIQSGFVNTGFGGIAQSSVAATAVMRWSHMRYAGNLARFIGHAEIVGLGFKLEAPAGQPYGAVDKVFSASKGDLGFELLPDPEFPLVRHGALGSFLQTLGAGETVVVSPAITVVVPGIPPFTKTTSFTQPAVIEDRFAQEYRDCGRLYANAANFTAKMREPWGIGQTELSTMQFLLDNGFVEGTLVPGGFRWGTLQDGGLKACTGPGYVMFLGKALYWKTEDGKPGCCVRYDDAAATASLESQKSKLSSTKAALTATAPPPPKGSTLDGTNQTILGGWSP